MTKFESKCLDDAVLLKEVLATLYHHGKKNALFQTLFLLNYNKEVEQALQTPNLLGSLKYCCVCKCLIVQLRSHRCIKPQ